jgi:hypothetical protein
MQSGTPAKHTVSARTAAVPKENVSANTVAPARAVGALKARGNAADPAVAKLNEQVMFHVKKEKKLACLLHTVTMEYLLQGCCQT